MNNKVCLASFIVQAGVVTSGLLGESSVIRKMMLLVGCFLFIMAVVLLGTTTTTMTATAHNDVSSDHGTNDTENVRPVWFLVLSTSSFNF